jgi:hypothetical protein
VANYAATCNMAHTRAACSDNVMYHVEGKWEHFSSKFSVFVGLVLEKVSHFFPSLWCMDDLDHGLSSTILNKRGKHIKLDRRPMDSVRTNTNNLIAT